VLADLTGAESRPASTSTWSTSPPQRIVFGAPIGKGSGTGLTGPALGYAVRVVIPAGSGHRHEPPGQRVESKE